MRVSIGVLLALVIVIVGVAQISGEWAGNVQWESLSATFSLGESLLSLVYSSPYLTVSSTSQFDGASGWVDQTFGLRGQLGPASVQGGIWFDPSAPAYLAAELTTALEVSGLSLSLTARHWPDDNYLWAEWYENESSPCASDIEAGLQYIFAAHYDPITI